MKMKKISLIRICLMIIALLVLFGAIVNIYYNEKYAIRNHEERELVCAYDGLIYVESFQVHKDTIICCSLSEYPGVRYIDGCSEILMEDYK